MRAIGRRWLVLLPASVSGAANGRRHAAPDGLPSPPRAGRAMTYRRVMDKIQQLRDYGAAQRAEGFAKGETAGQARTILTILGARGIAVGSETRARIEACTDAATLDHWAVRAVTAASAEEVIASTPDRAPDP